MVALDSDKYLYAALLLTLISVAYWVLFQLNAYNTFRMTTETANAAYPMYFYLNYPGSIHGLQFLVFQNQIEIDQLLILPIFALFQSSLTLAVVKSLIVSLTGLLLFFIVRDLSRNPLLALSFLFAYNLVPSVMSLQVFDYHAEVLILPFYLLTFYYFMKADSRKFYLFGILLLLTMETVLGMVFAFSVGLLAYEYLMDEGNELQASRIRLAQHLFLMAIGVLVLYNMLYFIIQGSYGVNGASLSPILQLSAYPFIPFNGGVGTWTYNIQNLGSLGLGVLLIFSFCVAFIEFGAFNLAAFVPSLIFSLPWFFGIFILKNSDFLYAWRYAYLIGGMLAGAILGSEILLKKSEGIAQFLGRFDRRLDHDAVNLLISVSPAVFGLLIVVAGYYLFFAHAAILSPTRQSFLFSTNQSEAAQYAQIDSVMAQLPRNASLMTQFNLIPSLAARKYVEPLSDQQNFFKPEYVLLDTGIAYGSFSQTFFDAANYINANGYYVYASNNTAVLLRRINRTGVPVG